jgi:hypothetical protein
VLWCYKVRKGNKRGSNAVQASRTRYSAIPVLTYSVMGSTPCAFAWPFVLLSGYSRKALLLYPTPSRLSRGFAGGF